MSEMQLYTDQGARLYLTPEEREAFARAARDAVTAEARTFCRTLYYTGCRISEALQLTVRRVDQRDNALTFRTLKKRGDKPQFRSVPVPAAFIDELNLVHRLKEHRGADARLWPWSRPTGWTRIKEAMDAAGIEGAQASPKGLRHGFGIACVMKEIPLPTIQKWLGHASLETTAIYTQALGEEEKQIAARLWE